MTFPDDIAITQEVFQDNDGCWAVCLPKRFYERAAIFAAAYKFNARCSVHIEPIGEDRVLVKFRSPEEDEDTLEQIALDFCREATDQQYRQDLQKQFGHLRDLIVEQAFKPVANLKEKLK